MLFHKFFLQFLSLATMTQPGTIFAPRNTMDMMSDPQASGGRRTLGGGGV
jgi:hypothetical protein